MKIETTTTAKFKVVTTNAAGLGTAIAFIRTACARCVVACQVQTDAAKVQQSSIRTAHMTLSSDDKEYLLKFVGDLMGAMELIGVAVGPPEGEG